MKQAEKENLAQALQALYGVSTKAPVEKAAHDTCLKAAQEIMTFIESQEVEKVEE